MAGTGLVFVGFVLLHMYGNLKLLSGEVAYNTYAEHLRTFGEPILPYGGLLWILRVVLIVCLVGHLYAAFSLWAQATLEAVKAGGVDPDAADHLLDEVEDATQTLLDARVLSDRRFIEDSITPLRQSAP